MTPILLWKEFTKNVLTRGLGCHEIGKPHAPGPKRSTAWLSSIASQMHSISPILTGILQVEIAKSSRSVRAQKPPPATSLSRQESCCLAGLQLSGSWGLPGLRQCRLPALVSRAGPRRSCGAVLPDQGAATEAQRVQRTETPRTPMVGTFAKQLFPIREFVQETLDRRNVSRRSRGRRMRRNLDRNQWTVEGCICQCLEVNKLHKQAGDLVRHHGQVS